MSKKKLSNGIVWDYYLGSGYYKADVRDSYGDPYFDKYEMYEQTDLGRRLNKARVEFVGKYLDPSKTVVDFGCGSGTFIRARGANTWGYDVCMKSVKWLVERDLWWDPWFKKMPSASFWDSLEHVDDLPGILSRVESHAFISIPIFTSAEHAVISKHFRPDEHFHYFTELGLKTVMKLNGFDLLESNSMETDLGREEIRTFAFLKRTR